MYGPKRVNGRVVYHLNQPVKDEIYRLHKAGMGTTGIVNYIGRAGSKWESSHISHWLIKLAVKEGIKHDLQNTKD